MKSQKFEFGLKAKKNAKLSLNISEEKNVKPKQPFCLMTVDSKDNKIKHTNLPNS
jgi:hypothetical protein